MGKRRAWTKSGSVPAPEYRCDLLNPRTSRRVRSLVLVFLGFILLACSTLPGRSGATRTPALPEAVLLDEVLKLAENCRSESGVKVEGDGASFSCYNSADTAYRVEVLRFASQADARARFEAQRGENPQECFHGYDLYEAASQHPNNQYIVQEQLGWQVGQWLVSIQTSFDYGYFHYTARGFAEWIYAEGVKSDLFEAGECP